MSYTFIDGNGSVLTADSSIISGSGISGVQRPIINIASILTPLNISLVGSPSISGAVTIVGTPSISGAVTVVGNPSVSGQVGASIIGLVPVTIIGSPSISGAVTVIGNPSVSGQLGASIIGTAPVTQSGQWNASVQGVGSVGGTIDIPVNFGGKAVSAEQTAVANNNKVQFVADLTGKQIILPYANPENFVSAASSVVTGTTAVSVLAAPGAGLRNYITNIKVTNAAPVGVIVDIKDTGANVLDTGYAAASGGGWSSTFPVPLRQVNSNASVDVVPRTQASVFATISGYKGV